MVKSMRKGKSCRERQLSAGVNVETNCPPEMNSKVKAALEREIAAFNRKAKKEMQHEAERSANGGPSLDSYSSWVEQHGGHEPLEANPDVLAEEEGIRYLQSKKDDEEVRLLKEVRHLFSSRELQAWNMAMVHGLSHQQSADLMNVSIKAFESYLKRAHTKFMNFMEEKKNERKS